MSRMILVGLALATWFFAFTTEASAVVCARGVNRAGCVGPNGAVIGRRTVVPRGRVIVHRAHRPVVVRRY